MRLPPSRVIASRVSASPLNVTRETESSSRSSSVRMPSDFFARSRRPGSAIDPEMSTTKVSAAGGRSPASVAAPVARPTRTSDQSAAPAPTAAPSTFTEKPLPFGRS